MDLYHALNRGVDKRQIVMDDRDRKRFLQNLYEMNDSNPVYNTSRRELVHDAERHVRKPLVQIHGWSLMGNHYHLLISEIQENGIPRFLQKLNMGYSKYFNEKYKRSGALFQGKTKRVLIESDAQSLYILLYIHCNPLDLLKDTSEWRSRKIESHSRALKWLTEYKWSSFCDYAGSGNNSRIIDGSEFFESRVEHVDEVKRYLTSLSTRSKLDSTYLLE